MCSFFYRDSIEVLYPPRLWGVAILKEEDSEKIYVKMKEVKWQVEWGGINKCPSAEIKG